MQPGRPRRLVKTGNLFYPTLFIIAITILIVWLSGRNAHRTIYKNALVSVSLLFVSCFIFLTWGLYYGYRLKDNIGDLSRRSGPDKNIFSGDTVPSLPDIDSGHVLVDIFLWILALIVILVFLYFFSVFLWAIILGIAGMLYWIYYRAVKLVFRKGRQCRQNLAASMTYAFYYTILYSCWIYAIILGLHYIL